MTDTVVKSPVKQGILVLSYVLRLFRASGRAGCAAVTKHSLNFTDDGFCSHFVP